MIEHQKSQHEAEIMTLKQSSDTKDFVRTNCKICHDKFTIETLRKTHIGKNHQIKITDYKKKYKQKDFYDLIEIILHKCRLCGEYLLLDSDAIAGHLKNKKKTHGYITHGKYSEEFMKTQRSSTSLLAIKYEGEFEPKRPGSPGPPGPPEFPEDVVADILSPSGSPEHLENVYTDVNFSLGSSSFAEKAAAPGFPLPVDVSVEGLVFQNWHSKAGIPSPHGPFVAGPSSGEEENTENTPCIGEMEISEDEDEDEKMDEDTGGLLEKFFGDECGDEEKDENQIQNVEIETPEEKEKSADDSIDDLLFSSDDEGDRAEGKSPVLSTEGVMTTETEVKKEGDFLSLNEKTAELQEYLQDLCVDPEDFKPLIGLLSIDFDNPESIPRFFGKFSYFGI